MSFKSAIKECKELNLTRDSIKTYFNAHDFYLRNSLELRKTYQLKEFYDQQYKHQNIDNYTEFKGFANYDASYDFEMFETLYDQTNKTLKNVAYPLGNFPSVKIPEYLKAMKTLIKKMDEHII